MKTTDEINEVSAALATAQGAFTEARLDGYNPHFKSDFATHASVVAASRPALAAAGLSVFQGLSTTDKGHLEVTTRLAHSSGQWIESSLSVAVSGKNPAQALGAAASYLRRYAYAALVGVAVAGEADLDGEGLDEDPPQDTREERPVDVLPTKWSPEDQRRFFARLKDAAPGFEYDEIADWCEAHRRPRPSFMSEDQRVKLLAWLALEDGGGVPVIAAWTKALTETTNKEET